MSIMVDEPCSLPMGHFGEHEFPTLQQMEEEEDS
jgi:hypothetical protein